MQKHIILVVEDDQVQKKQIIRCLKGEGFQILAASSGEEALDILKEQKIHLILTDRKMPGIDGDALLHHVRSFYPQIPVTIVTAFPEGVEELAPDAVLVKPYSADQLLKIVRDILERLES